MTSHMTSSRGRHLEVLVNQGIGLAVHIFVLVLLQLVNRLNPASLLNPPNTRVLCARQTGNRNNIAAPSYPAPALMMLVRQSSTS